jgi:hypothetical protein
MSIPNTGMALEDEVFNALPGAIKDGNLPVRNDLCKIHRRKDYYSETRKGNVKFENVIEIYSDSNFSEPNAQPLLVMVFECKDTGRRVEVGEVDEFSSKLSHQYGFATKGFIVTRYGFQKGALGTARSRGIGLIRLLPSSQFHYVIYHMTSAVIQRREREFPTRALSGLTDPDHISSDESTYCLDEGYLFASMSGVLRHAVDASGLFKSD